MSRDVKFVENVFPFTNVKICDDGSFTLDSFFVPEITVLCMMMLLYLLLMVY